MNLYSQIIYHYHPADIYMLKDNKRNTRSGREICSQLTIKTPERRQWHAANRISKT